MTSLRQTLTRTATIAFAVATLGVAQDSPIGIFDGQQDIGDNPKAGSAQYDASTGEYKVTGGGANIWATVDAFHFLWKKTSGDVTITADVKLVGTGGNAHRKPVLMVRQALTADSAYADAALHGDGMTSLQYRPTAGATTLESRATITNPIRLRIERRGNQFTMYAGNPGEELKPTGPVTVTLTDPVYVGIGVCSHDPNVLETAVFSNVKIDKPAQQQSRYRSRVTIYDTRDKSTRVVYSADQQFEAPNWSRDGKFLLINSRGHLYRLPLDSGSSPALAEIRLPADFRCNNDHDYSPDGKLLAMSCSSAKSRQSQVYIANADGSDPKLMTEASPSYFHGWSPDGKWIAIVGERNKNFDLFRMDRTGGEEQRLTSNPGYDDGPDYSPDGKWIYFNSNRAGGWDIWRMPASGAGPDDKKAERVTSDDLEDWFPHVSPNGKWIVFLSFPKGTENHNGETEIQLRMIPAPGPKLKPVAPQAVTSFFGGQGTINVNSWSPDSTRFAYVVYEKVE